MNLTKLNQSISKLSKKELAEIEFAFNVCKYFKSNAIVLTNNFSTIGIGAGQPSRLDSCKIATQKARQFQPSRLKNAIAASDAFFPFADGIKALIKSGIIDKLGASLISSVLGLKDNPHTAQVLPLRVPIKSFILLKNLNL